MEPRHPFTIRFADGATLELGRRTCVLGILNVTPDSFSDGGRFTGPSRAVEFAAAMAEAGADVVDVGGESTRPGASPVDAIEEATRVIPVVDAIKRRLGVRVSVDTTRAEVARKALDAGADMINDVSAFRDEAMLPLIAARAVPVIVMHMRGSPRTMQRDTEYEDLVGSIARFLEERAETAVQAGVRGDKIIVDPGIGFGKSAAGNLRILREIPALATVGRPILIGASRKSFIGATLDLPVDERLEGSLAIAAYAVTQGVHVVRAHDVAATVRAVRMMDAVRGVFEHETEENHADRGRPGSPVGS